MNQLLEKEQVFSIVPQDFKKSNKGKVLDIQDRMFSLEVFHAPDGILPKKLIEFYSQTKNGMLYFTSHVMEINDNILTVSMPRKHRFLQRRAFTRIKFAEIVNLEEGNKAYKAKPVDLSAGGMKLIVEEKLNIDSEYSITLNLSEENCIKANYQPIKIEKNEDGSYTLSGRFNNLNNTDRMKLIQFCIRKNIENMNR